MSHEPLAARPSEGKNQEKGGNFPPMGRLLHGNQPGNPNNAPRCSAKSKRTGDPCHGPAMKNGKCRMHGGKSKGPTTPEGLKRSQMARWKHGEYSRRAIKIMDDYLYLDGELIKRQQSQ
jgi:hypothetical protein